MCDNVLTAEEQAAFDAQREEADKTREAPADTEQVEAPVEDTAEEQEPADQRPKMVPHAALHEERERRKEIERQTAEKEKQWEQRYNLLLQRIAPPQQQQTEQPNQPPPLPDRDKDPVGYLEALALTAREEAAAARQALSQRSQQDQQVQVIQAIQQRATAAEMAFRQTNPDYNDAAMHLVNQRHQELELAGFIDAGERHAMIAQEALGLAARALQQGRNPAEVIYGLAKVNGYTTPKANPQPNPDEQLQAVARGQQQARSSLSSARGTGPSTVTGETIAKMTEEQFAAWYDKASAAQKRAVLGG